MHLNEHLFLVKTPRKSTKHYDDTEVKNNYIHLLIKNPGSALHLPLKLAGEHCRLAASTIRTNGEQPVQ